MIINHEWIMRWKKLDGTTWNASVGDDKKLGVATWVSESINADVDGTPATPGTRPV